MGRQGSWRSLLPSGEVLRSGARTRALGGPQLQPLGRVPSCTPTEKPPSCLCSHRCPRKDLGSGARGHVPLVLDREPHTAMVYLLEGANPSWGLLRSFEEQQEHTEFLSAKDTLLEMWGSEWTPSSCFIQGSEASSVCSPKPGLNSTDKNSSHKQFQHTSSRPGPGGSRGTGGASSLQAPATLLPVVPSVWEASDLP